MSRPIDTLATSRAPVAPLFVGPANAQHIVGQPWRWTRDFARRAGVAILRVGGKPLIRASELAAALEREAAIPPSAEVADAAQERDLMRQELGALQ
jgi:hypothetical protein